MDGLNTPDWTDIEEPFTTPSPNGLEDPLSTEPSETLVQESTEAAQMETVEETVAEETVETTAETVAATEPDTQGFSLNGGWLYAALALVVILLVCLVVDTLRRSKRRTTQAVIEQEPAADIPVTATISIPEAPVQIPVAAAVCQGQGAREDQQDCYGYSEPAQYSQQGVLAVVADGMGGLANGSVVSSALVRIFQEGFRSMGAYAQPADLLLEMAAQANAQINQMLRGTPRSGSTLVSAVIRDGNLYFLTVGDSRIYLFRSGTLLQLNRAHIYQEELAVRAVNREISLSQVQGDRQAQSLTSYFGIGKIPILDRNANGVKLIAGDRILLATDGVFGTLSSEQMEQALQSDISEAAKTLEEKVREADRPYQDNFTALILEYRG